jgi:hypothetical protein
MEYTDRGMWIHGVSEVAGQSILRAIFEFRAMHDLGDSDWHLRVYAVSRGYLDVWIGKPPTPTYREPYTILDDGDAGNSEIRAFHSSSSA